VLEKVWIGTAHVERETIIFFHLPMKTLDPQQQPASNTTLTHTPKHSESMKIASLGQ
jgi:hypothetical protein